MDLSAIILITLIIILLISLYLVKRNNKVCDFQIAIINMVFSKTNWENREYLLKKNSYNKMLFHVKPLQLKYWYTEEEINLLTKE